MTYWKPSLGDVVWWNRPDMGRAGRVVGFVGPGQTVGDHRLGQPIVERMEDEPPSPFGSQKAGDRFVVHPAFLLPFELGGDEWQVAADEGRIER
jgi:hypothetical protein